MDEHFRALFDNIAEASQPLGTFLTGRLALRVTDRRALNRTLISTAAFVSESRALFENLAVFYGRFSEEVFSEPFKKEESYKALARMERHRRWVEALREKRHLLLHYRSLWLAFDINLDRSPLSKPIILFNWRPRSYRARETLRIHTVHEIQRGLPRVAWTMVGRLVRRVRAMKPREGR